MLLEATHLKKYYGDRLIVSIDHLSIYQGDKIGIIGLNGAGKTTLLHLLAGEILPDDGVVNRRCSIAYLKQFSDRPTPPADPKLLKELHVTGLAADAHPISGGEHTRLAIADVLAHESLLVFADEPTANLDLQGVSYLTQKLEQTETLLLISHDRTLLDSLCTSILEIKNGVVTQYPGNFSDYDRLQKEEFTRHKNEYLAYVTERAHLEQAIGQAKSKAKKTKKAPKRMGNSEARLHKRDATEKEEKINNAANAIKTRLSHLEVKERPQEALQIKLDFSLTNPPKNKVVLSCDHFSFGYGERRLFDKVSFAIENGTKTALIGTNGSGKTTLLNCIHKGDLRVVPKAVLGYFHQGFENLDFQKTVLENVLEDSIQSETVCRTILSRLLMQDIFKKVGVLSGGERMKVGFAKLFVSAANVLLLDEPTNYLDMPSIQALQTILADYEGSVLFVSHDRSFVNAIADHLLILEKQGIRSFAGNLEQYERFIL